MFDDLEVKKTENLTDELKTKKEQQPSNQVKNNLVDVNAKVEEAISAGVETSHSEPDDMFDFGGENKKLDDLNKEQKKIEVDNNIGEKDTGRSLLGILVMDSLAKFLLYVIITSLLIISLSFWVSNLLNVSF